MATVDTPTDPTPGESWTNPFTAGTPLYDLFEEILSQDRDLIIIIDDHNARRGTGKTIASLQLANGMDQTPEGMTPEKATVQPEALYNAYDELPVRSGLVLDEGEIGASNRETQTKTNRALRKIMSIGRVRQKYVVVNTPTKGFIDKDIKKLSDVWISMTRRGRGLVHFMEWEPYSERLLTPKKQWIEFEDVPAESPVRNVYHKLTREKNKHIGGEKGEGYITESEHNNRLEKARRETRRETRNEIVRGIFAHEEIQNLPLSQRMVGEAIGVSQGTINNILQNNE